MKTSLGTWLLLPALAVANTPIPTTDFTSDNGLAAALATAPMWYFPSGTCMPAAAEDGKGNQSKGWGADHCNILKLNTGCREQPDYKGRGTFYGNIKGEPWANIPTYWHAKKCDGDNSWKILYYVYFPKDTGHRHDWEGIVLSFKDNGNDTWVRDYAKMEQDGKHKKIQWERINDTFDSDEDKHTFQQKNRNYAKFYAGKFHHSIHPNWHVQSFRDTCPPMAREDYRNADYQFWAKDHLRSTSELDPKWEWGKAVPPTKVDVCKY